MMQDPNAPPALPRAGITITQVLSMDRQVRLYGVRISDLCPRGDLGLGLDPEGPVGFALIKAYRRGEHLTRLREPLVLSVFGDGQPSEAGDADAETGERVWVAALADRVLRLELQHGSLLALLGEDRSGAC